jgi:predicted nuclease of restriction endonuclease-like (RecB) superfamily
MNFNKLVSVIESVNTTLRRNAVQAVNQALTIRNWLIGAYIVEYEQQGEDRAKYGDQLLEKLAKELRKRGFKGLSKSFLYTYKSFYLMYPQISMTLSSKLQRLDFIDKSRIFQTVSGKLQLPEFIDKNQIFRTLSGKFKYSPDINLMLKHFTFSHFLELTKADTPVKRAFYEIQAIKGNWTVRQLRRQMGSLLYERTGLSKNKEALLAKINSSPDEASIEEVIRDPYILEFTGLKDRYEYSENDLETALLDHIQEFLLELGTGFCFEARQKRISIGSEHDRIDLVFYHRILKCHILIDLKTKPFSNADAGQMNFYLNYFKDNEIKDGDNPPVGLILCTDKDNVKVQYATGGMENSLFISRYMVQLPSEKSLIEFIKKDIENLKK